MSRLALVAAAALAVPAGVAVPASAATVDIAVVDAAGRPVPDAVVTIESAAAPRGPVRFPWPMTIAQRDIAFEPHVLIVPVGAAVSFPNMDRVRHHVYSFAKAKRFQLPLYGQDQTRSVTFDKPGVVDLGCNIHDRMSGYVVVVATPFALKTDAGGHARIAGVPAGAAVLKLWSPQVRGPGNQLVQAIAVPPAGLARTIAVG